MNPELSQNFIENEKKSVFNDRFQIIDWLLNTQNARIYIGNCYSGFLCYRNGPNHTRKCPYQICKDQSYS